jgi:PhnB protein
MAVDPIPEGYNGLIPVLAVEDAAEAIDFYKRAFGATERLRMPGPGGKIAHAELEIGDGLVMLGDPFEGTTTTPPGKLGGASMAVFLYVEDVDAFVQRALDAGASLTAEVKDEFWGDRYGKLADPFGHQWHIATHIEDLSPEQMEERGKEAMAGLTPS